MIFIILLGISALSLAVVSGFFSIWGLSSTFHSIFWSVIAMGVALEGSKLMGMSFLYRHWKSTNWMLKCGLISFIFVLMCITMMGHFGYLSAGYQADSVQLKQIEQQVHLLDSEKLRSIDRKRQIDDQIASLPSTTARGRLALIKGFKEEQQQVTTNITNLEKMEVELKTKLIQSESHVGPIIYIAKMMGLDTDDATKYLIYLIIFVFDPMALVLTLAVNISIQEYEKKKTIIQDNIIINDKEETYSPSPQLDINQVETLTEEHNVVEQHEEQIVQYPIYDLQLEPLHAVYDESDDDISMLMEQEQPIVPIVIPEHIPFDINHILNNYTYYKNKIERGDILSQDENWSYLSLRDSLQKNGYNVYI